MPKPFKQDQDALDKALIHFYQTPASSTVEEKWREAVRSEEEIQMTKQRKAIPSFRVVTTIAATLVLVVGSFWAGQIEPMDASYDYATESAVYSSYRTNDVALTTSSTASASTSTDSTVSMVQTEQKLIRSANIRMTTDQFDTASEQITALIASVDGYNENVYQYSGDGDDGQRSVNWISRIPSDQLDTFLAQLQSLAKVTTLSESVQDQTLQYYDNEARIETLNQKMTRLQELLAQAETVSDMIEIESAIADTQYELDSYETWQTTITRDVDMSAVYISLDESVASTTVNASDEPLLKRMQAGFLVSIEWLVDFFQNMLVFIVMALPALVVVSVVVAIGRIVWKKKRRVNEDDTNQ